jgi:hypothetical protein
MMLSVLRLAGREALYALVMGQVSNQHGNMLPVRPLGLAP